MQSVFTPLHRGGEGPPLVCLHGFTDTWRTWDLALPHLEKHHDVLAPTLLGHAGGPPIAGQLTDRSLADAVERAMDDAGFETAHIAGNSLGGFVALQLAERGRARSVTALAPAGGWSTTDPDYANAFDHFLRMQELLKHVAPRAPELLASDQARRQATRLITTNYEHIPTELLVHQIDGVVQCAVQPMVEFATRNGYMLNASKIECPVRVIWGTDDKLLRWPSAAVRFKNEWLPNAEWIELDGIGHCPQLDVPLETAELIVEFTGA